MQIDDPIEQQLNDLVSIGEPYLPRDMAIHATSIAFPILGGIVTRIRAGCIQQRLLERLDGLFREFKKRLEEVEEIDREKIDRDFYQSSEFQTILILAMQQAQATHDSERLRMLGAVLANSGSKDFVDEHRKELFLRIMRDLTPDHIRMLADLSRGCVVKDPIEEEAYLCRSLSALGLTREFELEEDPILDSEFDALCAVVRDLGSTQSRGCFRITNFGQDFVAFIGACQPTPKESI